MTCWSCAEEVQGPFCGHCGQAQDADFALRVDTASVKHFKAGHRCLLRFQCPHTVLVRSSAFGGLREGPDVDFVPATAGQHEVELLVQQGAASFRAELRVVVATETQVAHAHIEIGRVGIVENVVVGSRGDLLQDGDWAGVPLRRVSQEEAERFHVAATSITTRKAEYRLLRRLAQGDFCTLYEASEGGRRVCVKLVDDPADSDLLQEEARVLRLLHGTAAPQTRHIPVLLDQFASEGRAGLVLQLCDGVDLRTLRAHHFPKGIDQRHVVWMMRRCLSTLGHAHAKGLLHGNIAPEHLVVRPGDHNVWLVDWCTSVMARDEAGFRVDNPPWSPPEVKARKPPLPSSDLFSLGRTMRFALGEQPVDERFDRFIAWFERDSPRQRPQDAWELYRKLDELRALIWGKHRFIQFVLPGLSS